MFHSPFDQPSYKPKAKKKRAAKKAKARKLPVAKKKKKKKKKAASKPLFEKLEELDAGGSCLRSPCRPWEDAGWFMDPKVGQSAVVDAMTEVRQGSPKLRRTANVEVVGRKWKVIDGKRKKVDVKEVVYKPYRGPAATHVPGNGKWPLSVACGLGVDSVAILVGLVQLYRDTGKKHWIPKSITFADVGAEVGSTYALLPKLNKWLKKNKFPPIQVMAYSQENKITGYGSWGTAPTLEIDCLNKHVLPSISYFGGGNHSCSLKFKIEAQEPWLKRQIELGRIKVPRGARLIRAIGYDATEDARMVGGGTYASDGEKASGFRAWYPLVEWGWDRSRCIAEIIHEFTGSYEVNKRTVKAVPRKSSCFFCGAMKPFEIAALPKDLLKRALFMEQVAIHGRHGIGKKGTGSMKGLGGGMNWGEFALGKMPPRAYTRQAVIYGTVYRKVRKRDTGQFVWKVDYYGAPKGRLDPERQYHQPGTGPLISKAEFAQIVNQAKSWVRATKGLDKQDTDVVCLPASRKIKAYTHILGFRGENVVQYDRLRDVILPAMDERAAREHRPGTKVEHERKLTEDQAECLRAFIATGLKNRRARRNPRLLPVVPQNILLLGGQDD